MTLFLSLKRKLEIPIHRNLEVSHTKSGRFSSNGIEQMF